MNNGKNQWGHSINSGATVVEESGKVRPKGKRPSHKNFRHKEDKNTDPGGHARDICAIANPGNVFKINVGGGQMGHSLSHDNEAPFPIDLPAIFIQSFARPDSIVADCFLGSGTTIDAAIQHGRRGIGCDVRQSQVELTERRMRTVTASMFTD